MSDVRLLLKEQRAARRVQHKHASYSKTGNLVCTICNFQIKSESLWEGHVRSAGHMMRLAKVQEQEEQAELIAANPVINNKRKRRVSMGEEPEDNMQKRIRQEVDEITDLDEAGPQTTPAAKQNDISLPSRPISPIKPHIGSEVQKDVNEDEWAAFEADIAAIQVPAEDTVISAPAMTAAEVEAKSLEDANVRRKETQIQQAADEKEEAARKLEIEFEQMEDLEERVKRLREKRETLRLAKAPPSAGIVSRNPDTGQQVSKLGDEDSEEEISDDDDWNGFMLKIQ